MWRNFYVTVPKHLGSEPRYGECVLHSRQYFVHAQESQHMHGFHPFQTKSGLTRTKKVKI